MLTPSSGECSFYYEDFARGAGRQECRAAKVPGSVAWRSTDCARCPVPAILAANGSPYLELRLQIRPGLLGVGRRVAVEAWCSLHGPAVEDARIGCSECNRQADELLKRALT